MSRPLLLALFLALAACGVRGPPRPPRAVEAAGDAGGPAAAGQPLPCAEADGGCAR